jgi:hypothetical protein
MRQSLHGWFLLSLSVACSKTRDVAPKASAAAVTQTTPKPRADSSAARGLQGSFTRVAKRASGTARFAVTLEGTHQLVLENVEVDSKDPIHVYLVARDDAPTTASVEATEDRYDIGVLDPEAPLQRFNLPSAPDAQLRVAVLWNVRFGVNLAQAQLR